MPLIAILIGGLFLPRVIMVGLWFFTNWFSGVFATWIVPLLGFVFMPYSVLWYSVVHNMYGGVWSPFALVGMVLAILLDLSSGGYGYKRYYVVEEVVG